MQKGDDYVFASIIVFGTQYEAILIKRVHCWRIPLLNSCVVGVAVVVVIVSTTVVAVDCSAARTVEGEFDGGGAIPCGSRDGACQGELASASIGSRDADMLVGL